MIVRDDGIHVPGGAPVVVHENDVDGITIRQQGYEEHQVIGLTVDQARRIATALMHLAEVVDREQQRDSDEIAKEKEARWNSPT